MLQQKFSWPVPYQTWEHIHIDHAGPVEDKMLLIVVDDKKKCIEVIPVPSINSEAINKGCVEFIRTFWVTEKSSQ